MLLFSLLNMLPRVSTLQIDSATLLSFVMTVSLEERVSPAD
ncbi:hypothetical protein RIEGSTA812A_PEG_975 [invertebrate metagenome]|uniref:Uncharacterized protein n=1 Tax=invertebrate metagenome TaxID=1711999 RepID=A0A484HCG7_9ZZZZ